MSQTRLRLTSIMMSDVRVPFGRAIEGYISSHTLLKNVRPKRQSRTKLNKAIKEGLVTLSRVEGAIDFVGWTTIRHEDKSTNRLDDILSLTHTGESALTKQDKELQKTHACGIGFSFALEMEHVVALEDVRRNVPIITLKII